MAEWFVSSAVLAALLIGAHYLLRGKISARLQYALWLVLLVRLLLPLSVGKTALSVANLLPEAEPAAVMQTEPAAAPPAQAASTPEPVAPAAPVQTPAQPVQRPASTPAQTETSSAEPAKAAQKPAVSVWKIFMLVWASGAALLGLWFLFCNLRYGRQLRAGVLRAIAPKEGRPAVRLTQTALSPCLFGLFPPAIYVTMDCAQDEQLLHHCAEHEYTHYLHRDHIWAVLRGVCLALHWFNPLVWWAAALSRTDAELFCDEDTVRRLGEDARADYGRSLIRMTCRERVDPLSAATTMSGRGGQLKTRIISITKHPKTAIPVLILVLLLCAAAVGCTMTGAKDAAPAQQTPERTETTPEELEATADTREEPEAAVEFTTTQDTVTLSVPARYENEITADDSFMIEAPETGEHDLDDVLFSFYDKSQAAEDRLGLVWAIRAFQFEDPAELVKDGADRWVEENLMALNTHLLGTRGSTAYYFFCLSPSDKAVRQYDSSDTAAISSYYQHAADGLDILKDFVVRNGLTPVDGAVDWEAWYQEFILPGIEAETAAVADAAWFAAREPVEQWPEFTVNGTSIYDLTLDDIQNVYGTYERILHWVYIQTDYYDVVEFADGSQAAGWMNKDGTIHYPNAAYLRLDAGVEVCGIRFGEDYREAEARAIADMQKTGKPFVVVVNTQDAKKGQADAICARIRAEYGVQALTMDCAVMQTQDIARLLEAVMYAFPVEELRFFLPSWVRALPDDHPVKAALYDAMLDRASRLTSLSEAESVMGSLRELDPVDAFRVREVDLGTGTVTCELHLPETLFYEELSKQAGVEIADDEALMQMLRELSQTKKLYEKVQTALEQVKATGYGIVMPGAEELKLEKPEIVKKNGNYAVKLRASAPSIHMMRAQIETEISPMVGGEQESQQLIDYLLGEYEEDTDKLWQSNIFGKSLYELVSEGVTAKIMRMPDDARQKLTKTLGRMINENTGGMICILL